MFDGWSPTQVQEHYDLEGNLIGRTVIKTEPLWDDSDRERALELEAVEAGRCTCGCNQPLAEAYDKDRAFDVIPVKCHAQAAIQSEKRKAEEKAEQGHARPGWDDGLRWIIQGSFPVEPKKDGDA